jgi:hypothetical protein
MTNEERDELLKREMLSLVRNEAQATRQKAGSR